MNYEDHPDFIELYNFKEDVNETRNLSTDEKYADKVKIYAHKCDSALTRLMLERIQPN